MTEKEVRKKYRLTKDMHTHTIYSHGLRFYSHGKGTIIENARFAAYQDIKEIAITDHGPGHLFYGIDQACLPRIREEIERAMEMIPGMKILLGVEANIINSPNGLDLPAADFDKYDIVLAGYHFGVPHGHTVGNWTYSTRFTPAGSREGLRIKNTEMVLRALYENNIFALTHPGDKAPFDMRELCKACEETGTLMEINTRHRHLTVDELKIARDFDVKFIVSSDAHTPIEVGKFAAGVVRALEAGIEVERIVNIAER